MYHGSKQFFNTFMTYDETGGSYNTAVVVTKNNESGTLRMRTASGLGRPASKGASMANVTTDISNVSESVSRLQHVLELINKKGALSPEVLLHCLEASLYTKLPENDAINSRVKKSRYLDFGNITLRVSDFPISIIILYRIVT